MNKEANIVDSHRISATLSPEDQAAVLASIQSIKEKLSFLIDLSPEERRILPKMGDKSRAFVSKALEVAAQNEDLSRSFSLEEMRNDVVLFGAMQPILIALTQLLELVDDTLLATGNEAYTAALAVYHYARASGQGAALDALADSMAQRFARKSSSPPPAGG